MSPDCASKQTEGIRAHTRVVQWRGLGHNINGQTGPSRFWPASCNYHNPASRNRQFYQFNSGTPQKLDPEDIAYAASYLRYIGSENTGASARWTMPVEKGCSEWALPIDSAGTVLALAKHVEPALNSSVLYEDLANTIDGGANGAKASTALVKCGANGGQMGVIYNATNPAYNTAEYKKVKATPKGIVIKLVRAPGS